jgi:hypothetical protein
MFQIFLNGRKTQPENRVIYEKHIALCQWTLSLMIKEFVEKTQKREATGQKYSSVREHLSGICEVLGSSSSTEKSYIKGFPKICTE